MSVANLGALSRGDGVSQEKCMVDGENIDREKGGGIVCEEPTYRQVNLGFLTGDTGWRNGSRML